MRRNKSKIFFSFIKAESGSTFVMVLMILLVLSILGAVLISASTLNFVASRSYLDINSSFYTADGVMEQAQVALEQISVSAQESAKNSVQSQLPVYMELDGIKKIDEATGEAYVDADELDKKINEELEREYYSYILNNNDEKIDDALATLSIEKDGTAGFENNYYKIDSTVTPIEVEIRVSRAADGSTVQKRLQAVFQLLREPEQVTISKNIKREEANPIWERPITTEADLIAVGGKVTINALVNDKFAVYALGTVPTDDNRPGEEYGGIVAGVDEYNRAYLGLDDSYKNSGKIEIKGRVATKSYIHTFNNGSEIIVKNSNTSAIFAQAIQTEWSSNGGIINISGNTKVSDDVEINGIGDTIIIEGTLFGFGKGDEEQIAYNKSSSILYNDPTYTSKINILKEIYIGGLAYIDSIYWSQAWIDNSKYIPYKTGESLAIGKNFYAYTYPFNSNELPETSITPTPTPIPPDYLDRLWKFRVNSVAEAGDPEYPMYSGVMDGGANNDGGRRVERFKEYVLKQKEDSVDFASTIQRGKDFNGTNYINIGAGVDNEVQGYAVGVIPANGYVYMANFDQNAPGNQGYVDAGIRSFDESDSLYFSENQVSWKNQFRKSTYILRLDEVDTYDNNENGPSVKNSSEFSDLVDIPNTPDINTYNAASGAYLRVADGSLTIDVDDLLGSSSSFKGLIYSNGDIEIKSENPFTFNGAIVAKGKIVFSGTGTKTITYDGKAVRDAVSSDQDAYAFFSKGFKESSYTSVDNVSLQTQVTRNVRIKEWREIQ